MCYIYMRVCMWDRKSAQEWKDEKKSFAFLCKELIIQSYDFLQCTKITTATENSNKLINHTVWRITEYEYDLDIFLCAP